MAPLRLALILIAVGGCVAEEGSGDGGAAVDARAGADAGDCSAPPAPRPSWLQSYQQGIVGRLSGQLEISDGVLLEDRDDTASRAATRTFLIDELQALGLDATLHDYGGGANVWAELPATAAGAPTIVVGAHFDSVPGSPGANDNATGVAMVLAAARYLSQLDCRSHIVAFVLFDEEEIGLVGSYHAALRLVNEDREVAAVHTVDQMGWDGDADRLVELELPTAELRAAYEAASIAGGFAIPLLVTTVEGSDHTSFRNAGFPATGVTEGFFTGDSTPYYHSANDRYDTVDFSYLGSSSGLFNLVLARALSEPATAAVRGHTPPPLAPRPPVRAPRRDLPL